MNPFRQLMRAAGPHSPLGTYISSASPLVAEAVGHAGFDWGIIDMEHAPVDTLQVLQMLQAVGNTKMVPLVCVPWNEPVLVKRVLDAGATTVLFPFVESAADAQRAVAATRYPPQGVRGMSNLSRASQFGAIPNYVANANADMAVIVQIESVQALAQLEEIARVPGVDALFVGPADLSASMGHVGRFAHPAVLQAMADVAARARAIGKLVGAIGNNAEVVTQYRAMGYDFIGIGSDLALLMAGARSAVQALRMGSAETHVHSLDGGTQTDGG